MEKRHQLWLGIAAAIVVALWFVTPFGISKYVANVPRGAGEFGDMFGATNALFSGLALIGVVAAILLQQQELRQSTTELRNSSRALTRQVELSADTARIQTLPILIQLQKLKVQTYGAVYFNDFAQKEHSDGHLKDRVIEMEQIQRDAPDAMRKLADELMTLSPGRNVFGEYEERRYGEVQRELGEWQQKLSVSNSVLAELQALIEYREELVLLYRKMKSTRLNILEEEAS